MLSLSLAFTVLLKVDSTFHVLTPAVKSRLGAPNALWLYVLRNNLVRRLCLSVERPCKAPVCHSYLQRLDTVLIMASTAAPDVPHVHYSLNHDVKHHSCHLSCMCG